MGGDAGIEIRTAASSVGTGGSTMIGVNLGSTLQTPIGTSTSAGVFVDATVGSHVDAGVNRAQVTVLNFDAAFVPTLTTRITVPVGAGSVQVKSGDYPSATWASVLGALATKLAATAEVASATVSGTTITLTGEYNVPFTIGTIEVGSVVNGDIAGTLGSAGTTATIPAVRISPAPNVRPPLGRRSAMSQSFCLHSHNGQFHQVEREFPRMVAHRRELRYLRQRNQRI